MVLEGSVQPEEARGRRRVFISYHFYGVIYRHVGLASVPVFSCASSC